MTMILRSPSFLDVNSVEHIVSESSRVDTDSLGR